MNYSQILAQLIGGIMTGGIRGIDLTGPLGPETPVIKLPPQFAPSKSFSLDEISRYDERGPTWYWNNISCGEHTGTHFDAPIHWLSGSNLPNNTVETVPVARLVAPACVIDCSKEAAADADYLLTADVIRAWEAQHGRIPP